MEPTTITFESGTPDGRVSALLLRPENAWAAYVMAHGAGAGMHHPFLEAVANALAERDVATLRYQFPYMEIGKRRPDRPEVAQATVRRAVATALLAAPGLPLVAGGKSFGGRMTSQAYAEKPLDSVRGLVFLGFPLHPTGRPGVGRGDHLSRVHVPMLFLQGTRDTLAELELIQQVCDRIGGRATLSVLDGGDHSFHVKGRGRRIDAEVIGGLAATIVSWTRTLVEA
jgi:predicted alpha/beta-hydrolase family hydrolase